MRKMSTRNTTGVTGVCYDKRKRRYVASIIHEGERFYLGKHKKIEDAAAARKAAEQHLYKTIKPIFKRRQEKDSTIKCPICKREEVKKFGYTQLRKPRYLCINEDCEKRSFIVDYTHHAFDHKTREYSLFLIAEGHTIKNSAKHLQISRDVIMSVLRNVKPDKWYVNYGYVESCKKKISVLIALANKNDMSEMWKPCKDNKLQLRWVVDSKTEEAIAFCFSTKKYKYADELLTVLKQFKIKVDITDEGNSHEIAHLKTLCSNLIIKGMGFSKDELFRDIT